MKYFNKFLFFIVFAVFILFVFPSCITTEAEDGGRLKITATLFPQYDFAKIIAGDKAAVSLILPPGIESHGFDPKPSDILAINNSDIFIYTGKDMEPWSETIIKGVNNKNLIIADCSSGIEFLHHSDEDYNHDHGADPHIWLNPENAVIIVKNILAAIISKDPENSDYYNRNAEDYIKKLQKLDEDISEAVESSKRRTIVFGGRFAYIYFLERYNLDYITAYDSCSAYSEPGALRIAQVIDFIDKNNIACIYHEELSEAKIAKSIASQTNIETLRFSTAHNITKSEFENGVTFLDVMYANLENLKKGLN
ncbi:MAG: zinc ABC transporter substrate-binding protein [Oscillospiraceae bacterium]|nr:zinc ABC transporter substrate-binding protein [Oscillospiraceae bacterium]